MPKPKPMPKPMPMPMPMPMPVPKPNQVAEGSDVESLHDQGLSGDCQRRLVG